MLRARYGAARVRVAAALWILSAVLFVCTAHPVLFFSLVYVMPAAAWMAYLLDTLKGTGMNGGLQAQAGAQADFYAIAAQRTLRQFIDAFWFEGALDGVLQQRPDGGADLTLAGRDAGGQRYEYRISAAASHSFGRYRLYGPLTALATGLPVTDISMVAGHLLADADAVNKQRFIDELIHTTAKQALSLQAQACTAKGQAALALPFAWQEALLGDGHLYHPCYRSRMGFDLTDHQRYGPEFGQAFHLVWVALDKQLAQIHGLSGDEYTAFLRAENGDAELDRLLHMIRLKTDDSSRYLLMPVHPWHWQHKLQIQYADWLADGRLLYLGEGQNNWLAQQSVRSLSPLSQPAAHHLKLPLGIANSSADRILSDHHVHNAPLISVWLTGLCAQDAFLQQHCRLAVLAEPAGITLTEAASRQDRYGLLSAIWRQSPAAVLRAGECMIPCTVLSTENGAQLNIAPWLQQHGTEVWVAALLEAVLPPFIHLMLAHGVLLEAHAQNTLLIVRDGLPAGVAIRDLHGGLHYIAGQTTDEAGLQHLRQAPAHRNAANASNGFAMHTVQEARDYLLEVLLFINLSELAYRLALYHGFSEAAFWRQAVKTLQRYQDTVPFLQDKFTQFDLFVPQLQLEKLASRRLSAAQTQSFHAAANPLYQYRQTAES